MNKLILISMLSILSTVSSSEITVNSSSDTQNIIIDSKTTENLKVTGEGPYTAGGNSGNPDPNWYLHGYKVMNGATLDNIYNIELTNKYNNGILLSKNSSASNSGIININGYRGLGILSADGTGNMINTSTGVINITDNGTGIGTKGFSGPSFTGTIQNNGLISSTNGGTGIFVYGSQSTQGGVVTNNGIIRMNGGSSGTAIYASGNSNIINNNEVSGSSSLNMSSNALISIANGAHVTNSETGVITGKNYVTGIYSQNSNNTYIPTIVNDGKISVEKGHGIYGLGTSIINNGEINADVSGIYGTKYSNINVISKIINNGTVKINSNGTGITASQSSMENNGSVIINGNNAIGIYITGSGDTEGKLVNNGKIIADADKTGVTLIKLSGSTTVGSKTANLYNFSDLTSLGDNSIVIHSLNESKINNSGNITVNNGIGIKLEFSSLLEGDNTGLITVKGSGIGILAGGARYRGSILINDGKIVLEKNGTGIYVASGNAYTDGSTGENKGEINFNGEGGTGIYATDQKTVFKNSAFLISEKNNTYGIVIDNKAEMENTGNIILTGEDSVGISLSNGGRLTGNTGNIEVNNGIGIKVLNSELGYDQNTGIITINSQDGAGIAGVNSKVINNGIIYVNGLGLGIYGNNSELENYGDINISDGTGLSLENNSTLINSGTLNISGEGIGIKSDNSNIENAGSIEITEGTGIYSKNNTYLKNSESAVIRIFKGTNIKSDNSSVENKANLINENGTGISGNNSFITNEGRINIRDGLGILAENNSLLNNNGDIKISGSGTGMIAETNSNIINNAEIKTTNGTGIISNDSYVTNNGIIVSSLNGIESSASEIINTGIINSSETGIYSVNDLYLANSGEINSKTGVVINTGSNEYSGHFLNTGKITGTEYAIKFDNENSVLELRNGTEISGLIDASQGENSLIIGGNVKLEQADNFSKLIVSQDTVLYGTVNLNPSTNDEYYISAFSNSKKISDISSENLGELVLNGTINLGVDYDGISHETDKTGKILTGSLNVQNGGVVLNNAGNTTNDLITESGLSEIGDQIRIKSIIISNKQQAVDPNFSFQADGGMIEKEGWSRETVSRIENGVTVLDELYTKNTNEPIQNPEPEPEKPSVPDLKPGIEIIPKPETNPKPGMGAEIKKNSVPRNRVDLDNVKRIETLSSKFLDMESSGMLPGEKRQSLEYVGTKAGSHFEISNNLNYGYDVDSNGVAGTTLNKYTDNLYSGFTLAYTNNKVEYSNGDGEKINSFNVDVFGRYKTGNWDFDVHMAYGFNRHELEIDWLGAGQKESEYDSHVLKTGLALAYNQSIGNRGLKLRPGIALDYVNVSESAIRTPKMASIDSSDGDGLSGKIKLDIGNTEGKFLWNAGVAYEQNFNDTFHRDRRMSNSYVMEKLHYGKETFLINLDADFKLTEKLTLKTGYEYENNSNYENHKFKTGISYILGEK